jgi:predicted transcriptional regulator
MQNHYRNKFDIISLILDIANGNKARQADILIKANIPYTLFKEYLFLLHQSGLIEIECMQPQYQRTYKTTAKGVHFLDICNKMRAFCDISPYETNSDNIEVSVL